MEEAAIGEKWEMMVNGLWISFWGGENVLELWAWLKKPVNILKTIEMYNLPD